MNTSLRLHIPTKMDSLKPKHLRFVSWLFLQGYSETEFLVKAFLKLSGLKLIVDKPPAADGAKWYTHANRKKPFLLESDLISDMAERCRFMLEPGEVKPIKWVRFARARHFRLQNACFEEYLMAENYYFAYLETKKEEHLDNLISVLYRRPWQRWVAKKIRVRAGKFRKVSPAVKNSVFIWYVGFRSYVPKRCPALFSGKKSNKPFSARNYINGMVHQLTNGNITLKKELLKQPIWDALDELEQRAVDAEMLNEK